MGSIQEFLFHRIEVLPPDRFDKTVAIFRSNIRLSLETKGSKTKNTIDIFGYGLNERMLEEISRKSFY